MKELTDLDDDFLANSFADKFAMFADSDSIFLRGFGEELTPKERMFFYEMVTFLQAESARDGTAFLVRYTRVDGSVEAAL